MSAIVVLAYLAGIGTYFVIRFVKYWIECQRAYNEYCDYMTKTFASIPDSQVFGERPEPKKNWRGKPKRIRWEL